MTSQSFYRTLLAQLSQGPVVVATVIAADVTIPTESTTVGAKLLVWGDAETCGPLDAAPLMQPAFEVMKTGLPQQVTLAHGGNLQIWLARWQGVDAIATVQSILSNLSSERPQRLVIPLVSGQTAYVIEAGQSLRNLQGQNAFIEEITEWPVNHRTLNAA
ncbi:MAG: XdhC family protein [Cyanobacteria bacterium J06632_22]